MVAIQPIRLWEPTDFARPGVTPYYGSGRSSVSSPSRGGRSSPGRTQITRTPSVRNGGANGGRRVLTPERTAPLRRNGRNNSASLPATQNTPSWQNLPISRLNTPAPMRQQVSSTRTGRSPGYRDVSPINIASSPLRPEEMEATSTTTYGGSIRPYRVRRTVEIRSNESSPWTVSGNEYPEFSPEATYQGPIDVVDLGPQYILGPGGQRNFTWEAEVRNATTGQVYERIGIQNGAISAEQWIRGLRAEDFVRNPTLTPLQREAPGTPYVPDPGVTTTTQPPQRNSPLRQLSPRELSRTAPRPLTSAPHQPGSAPNPFSPSSVPSLEPLPTTSPNFAPTPTREPEPIGNPAYRPFPTPSSTNRPTSNTTTSRPGAPQRLAETGAFRGPTSRGVRTTTTQPPATQPPAPPAPPICAEPCIQEILARARSTDRRLERLEDWLRELFETPEQLEFTVTSQAPDALIWQGEAPPNDTYNPPPYQQSQRVYLPRIQALFEALRRLDEFSDYRNRQIRNIEQYPVAAVPEHWQVRRPQVPQACLLLADLDPSRPNGIGSSRWSLTIPHYKYGPDYAPSLQFQKGSHFGSMKLSDGSQVIVNCVSASECERVISDISELIDSEYIPEQPEILLSERSGQRLSDKNVKAIRITYHSEGQASTTPDWIKYLQ